VILNIDEKVNITNSKTQRKYAIRHKTCFTPIEVTANLIDALVKTFHASRHKKNIPIAATHRNASFSAAELLVVKNVGENMKPTQKKITMLLANRSHVLTVSVPKR